MIVLTTAALYSCVDRPARNNEYQRFVPTPGEPSTAFALDTKTGQLCRTYDWKESNGKPVFLPLCSDLLSLYPTGKH